MLQVGACAQRSSHAPALQANTLRDIDEARRLDQDLLARRMTDLGGLRAHARRYRELKGREPSWEVPELNVAE